MAGRDGGGVQVMEEGSGGRLVASAGRGGDGREQQELRRVPVGGELRQGGGCIPTRGGAGQIGRASCRERV